MPKFTKLLSTLILLFAFVSLLQSQLYAQGITFQQQDDEFGLVVMEAENYTEQIPTADAYFEFVVEPDLFSGDGALQALPEDAVFADAASALANSPVLNYEINFIKADSVFIWTRGSHTGGGDDSYHAGVDGIITEGTDRIGFHGEAPGEWYWLGIDMDNLKPVFYIDSPGVHVFQVFMREGGLKIDKFVLTTSRDYDPLLEGDMGPDETPATGVESPKDAFVQDFRLNQNYPNPFNPSTTITYNLAKASRVSLKIYNVSGNLVTTLVNDSQDAGNHAIAWNAIDENNNPYASGIYLARLVAGLNTSTIRMLLMR
jgi:hypothetical protein